MSADIEAFEALYRREGDPWATLSDPVEQEKIERVVAALGDGPLGDVCELGAGVGALTERLAPRATSLLALDGAPTAVTRAAERLAPWPHARARVAVLPDDLPTEQFDLIVASEVLYYLEAGDLRRVVVWATHVLRPGGRLAAVHWTGAARDLRRSADAVHTLLLASPELRPLHSERGATWRLDVLVRP